MTDSQIIYSAPKEGFWEIPGVVYRGETGTYRFFEKMTPSMNQRDLEEFYKLEKQKGNPYPINSILQFAIFSAAYNIKDKNPRETGKLRNFFRKSFRKNCPNTLTKVIYNSSEEDKIIHNCNTSDEYFFYDKVVGPDGRFVDIPDKELLRHFLGTNDVDKINEAFQWINGSDGYLCRLNSKPLQKEEYVVGFDASDDGFYLYCEMSPLGECPVFRVLRVD